MPFQARDLPRMIDLNGDMVAGPFCVHCGYPFTLHSAKGLLCPVIPNAILRPICTCHVIRQVEVKRGRRTIKENRIVRRA